MSFALTFSWRRFVLAMWNRDCPNKNKNAIFAFGVPTKNFAHEMLPPELGRVYLSFDHVSTVGCNRLTLVFDTTTLAFLQLLKLGHSHANATALPTL